jgi:hypothetical protein
MKYTKRFILTSLIFIASSAQADLPPVLDPPLNSLTIYSGAAITMGASSVVNGNIQVNAAATIGASSIVDGYIVAGAAATLGASTHVGGYIEARDAGTIGADSTIGGHLTTGDAATLGANTIDGNIMVGGDLTAGAAILAGAKAVIAGNLKAGADASADLGADAKVIGNAAAGTGLTLGADVIVDGHAQAGSGSVMLGVGASVVGNARAGTSIVLAAGATIGGDITQNSPEAFATNVKQPIDDKSLELLLVQAQLATMVAPLENQLPTAMTVSRTIKKGIYHTTALTTTAGITITFDGEGEQGHWLINSDSFIAFGASTKIILKDVTSNSTITWNAASYASSGASAELRGTFFAGSYILTGEFTVLGGVGDTCGRIFTTTGAVTLGASNIIGTPGCTEQPLSIDHYEIVHDGQGLTCDSESVILRACNDASCSTLSSQPITLDFLTNGESISSPTFIGSKTIIFNNLDVETLTFSLANTSITAANPPLCDDSSTNSCDMNFTNAGLRFLSGADNSTTLPNQIAGSVFVDTLKIQAVQDTDGVCTALFTGNNNVYLSQENIDPGGTNGLSFTSDGVTIAKHADFTSTTLNFGSDSIAVIPTPIYHDAGQIRLHANYDLGGVTLSGSSNAFWVSPGELVIVAKSGVTNLNGATSTATPTHKTGNDFDLSVTALNSLGVITPNYSGGQIQLMLTRTGPTLSYSADGDLSYGAASKLTSSANPIFENVTLTNFVSGVSTYNAAQYSEVGLLNLDAQDNNYGNANIIISAVAIDIGRFIPDHFTQTVAEDGYFLATCNTAITFAAYSGQKDEATNSIGTIAYLTNPVLVITAFNKQGHITQNYHQDSQGSSNDYMKLSNADINVSIPTLDQVAVGVDNNKLSLTASMNSGTLSKNNLTPLSNGAELARGILHYQLSDADHFFYNRSANSLVAPFTSDIDFSIDTIVDADNVTVTSTIDASPAGVEIRFGRLVLKNSFGPETSNFPQPLQIEHFNGVEFGVTRDDNCASYDADKISLVSLSSDPLLNQVLGGTGYFLTGKTQAIELQAPGAGHQGQMSVTYDAYDWFKYDWDNDDVYDESPFAVATFGVFRGNDRIGFWRESFY